MDGVRNLARVLPMLADRVTQQQRAAAVTGRVKHCAAIPQMRSFCDNLPGQIGGQVSNHGGKIDHRRAIMAIPA